ncbi:MAG: DUF1552 domain-containing protein [Myxococcota bacterium]
MNRRQFLLGAGGFALAMPMLPSLLPRHAWATDGIAGPKRFVCMTSHHGGVWARNMYPDDATLSDSTRLAGGGHTLRHGALSLERVGADNRLSPCLSAPSGSLTPALASRMNVLRGLDIPFYINHHAGGYLGNYARNDAEYEGGSPASEYRPTIDQMLANSPHFYDDLSGILQKSLHIGQEGQRSISWRRTDPSDSRSPVVASTPVGSSRQLFDQVFREGLGEADRGPVVDKVLAHYNQLRSGAFGDARRLSANDRRRLDEHVARLAELERSLQATTACVGVSRPSGNAGESHPGYWDGSAVSQMDFHRLYNEVVAIALNCDTSRVVTIDTFRTFYDFGGDWHQDVAHRLAEPDRQAMMLEGQRRFFETIFVDLCNRLMMDQGGGTTVLDDSLVMWVQESGTVTHDSLSMPVVTAGSAGGAIKTGQYIDYRDRSNTSITGTDHPEQQGYRPGLLYSQWLATAMQSLGVRREEYQRTGEPGYGEEAYDWFPRESWSSAVRGQSGEMLPLIGA